MAADTWRDETLAALSGAGFRIGGARRAVVDLLSRQECCLSAQQIFDRLREEGRPVGVASVYRVLELLDSLGRVQRVEVGSGTALYEPAHVDGEHHHHIVCDDCGTVQAFDDPELEGALLEAQERLGYARGTHDLVVRGSCGDCRDA